MALAKLSLYDLHARHAVLRGQLTDLPRAGGLALQRAGHSPPVGVSIEHDGIKSDGEIDWAMQDLKVLAILDSNRLTEDAAEAVAISYAHSTGGWTVKRRLQQGERADWLLRKDNHWLVLEVSGTIADDPFVRLRRKRVQLRRCSLPAAKTAIVVSFGLPSITAEDV